MDKLLSVEETGQMTGLSPWTIRALIRSGKLGRVKIGRRVLVETSAVRAFIESCKEADRIRIDSSVGKGRNS
jgi:excisionase family DNA binding protein